MGIVQRREQWSHPPVDGVSGIRQAQVTRGALDQPQAEISFQSLHRSTQARFRMPEHACGGAEPAVFNDFAKQLPIAPLHASDCPCRDTVCPENSDYREAVCHLQIV
jgi:hypothetical protein